MSFLRKIAYNTFYQIISRLVSSSAGFLIAILVARHYGINGYADYAKVSAFVGLFYLFVDFGFNAIFLQKFNAHKRAKELFLTRVVFSFGIFLILNAVAFFLPYNHSGSIGFSPAVVFGIFIFSLTLFSEGIIYSANAVFQKNLSYKYAMIATLIGSIITLPLVGITIILSLPLSVIFISFVFGGLLEAVTAARFSGVKFFSQSKLDTLFVRGMVKDAFPVAIMLICNLIYFRIDMILLSFFVKGSDVAIYDFAYKFFDFLIAIPLFLSNAIYPSLILQAQNGQIKRTAVIKYLLIFVAVSFVIVLPVLIFAPLIGLLKSEFLRSAVPLRILTLSLPLFFATSLLQWMLLAKKQQSFLVVVYCMGAIVNIGLNLVFIPQYSYIAASIITGISELFIFIFLVGRILLIK